MLLKILIVFFAIIAYKGISNYVKYRRCKKLSELHFDWLVNQDSSFYQYRSEALNLLKGAGVKDSYVPASQPIGFGQVANANVSIYENFPSLIQGFAAMMATKFDDAIGVYKKRTIEAINPLYWIETILFLPRHVLEYIGMKDSNVSFRILNVVLTFIWWLVASAFTFLRPYFQDFVTYLFS